MPKNILEHAIAAALLAGKSIMQIYHAEIEIEYKEDASPVTQADRAADAIIRASLKKLEIPFITEETKTSAFQVRKNWQQCWIVDPIDGTKEFIKRNGEFTVNIALVENKKPILGVIYAPSLNELFFAEKDTGAFHIKIQRKDLEQLTAAQIIAQATPIRASFSPSQKLVVLCSRSHHNEPTKRFIDQLKLNYPNLQEQTLGSSLKFCRLAEGKAQVFPRFLTTMEWDTAAGHIICNEAGVELYDADTKKPLIYNKPNLKNPSFVAINKALESAIE